MENKHPVSFEDAVKQRLKSVVAELIPEERWDDIVRKTVEQFEKSDLPKIVRDELIIKYREMIKEEFSKPEWVGQWAQDTNELVSEKVRQLIIESAPLVFASMMQGAMHSVMQDFRNGLANGSY